MFITNFILKLLATFVPFETGEYEKLRADTEAFWNKIQLDPSKSLEENQKLYPSQNKTETMFKYYASMWWVRCILAGLYIFLYREIRIYMNPQLSGNKQIEDAE